MISNVVLVNMLIAMMGKTYDDVQQKSIELWRMQRYRLLEYYEIASPFPMPIGSVHQVLQLITYYQLKRNGDASVQENSKSAFELYNFQSKCIRACLDKSRRTGGTLTLADVHCSLQEVQEMVHMIDARVSSLQKRHDDVRSVWKNHSISSD